MGKYFALKALLQRYDEVLPTSDYLTVVSCKNLLALVSTCQYFVTSFVTLCEALCITLCSFFSFGLGRGAFSLFTSDH